MTLSGIIVLLFIALITKQSFIAEKLVPDDNCLAIFLSDTKLDISQDTCIC